MATYVAVESARRAAIVEFVTDYWTVNGYAPSLREVARGVGLRQPASVAYQVDILVAAGVLQRTAGVARSLRVAQQP